MTNLPSQKFLLTHWREMTPAAKEAAWQIMLAIYSLQGELDSRNAFIEKLFEENAKLKVDYQQYIERTATQLQPRRLWMDALGYFDRARA